MYKQCRNSESYVFGHLWYEGGKVRRHKRICFYFCDINVLIPFNFFKKTEKGLPPSRLMEEHAALSTPPPAKSSSGSKFECDRCDFVSDTQHGLKVHMGKSHKNAEVLRDGEHEVSLAVSFQLLDAPTMIFRDKKWGAKTMRGFLHLSLLWRIPSILGLRMTSWLSNSTYLYLDFHLFHDKAKRTQQGNLLEDDPPHRCHPWEPCRNLKCRVKAAAGECDDCQ